MDDFDEYEEETPEVAPEELMENDEVSPEEEGFLKGYDAEEEPKEETEEDDDE